MRLTHWLALPSALVALCFAPLHAQAEDPPAGAPPAQPATKDFAEIQNDWRNNVKKKGDPQLAKERALFWEEKGVKGVGLLSLGMMWNLAGDTDKTVATLEAYLKVPEAKDANRETALFTIMLNHSKAKAWDKAIATGDLLLKTYPLSGKAAGSANELGRVYRRAGKDDKAAEYFAQAAEGKSSQGIFDLIDLHLVAGKVDEAKKVCAQYSEGLKPAVKATVDQMKVFLDDVGKPAPALEGVKSPTKSQVPEKFGGKPTVLFYVYLQMKHLERNLHTFDSYRNGWDNLEAFGVMTHMKYEPYQRKVIADMTEDQEVELQGKILDKESGGAQVLTIPAAVWGKLHQRSPGQKTILDAEGKFLWTRFTHQGEYDWFSFRQALTKFVGKGADGDMAAPPPDAEGGGEAPGGGGEAPGGEK